jgi:hypothetical protein
MKPIRLKGKIFDFNLFESLKKTKIKNLLNKQRGEFYFFDACLIFCCLFFLMNSGI